MANNYSPLPVAWVSLNYNCRYSSALKLDRLRLIPHKQQCNVLPFKNLPEKINGICHSCFVLSVIRWLQWQQGLSFWIIDQSQTKYRYLPLGDKNLKEPDHTRVWYDRPWYMFWITFSLSSRAGNNTATKGILVYILKQNNSNCGRGTFKSSTDRALFTNTDVNDLSGTEKNISPIIHRWENWTPSHYAPCLFI